MEQAEAEMNEETAANTSTVDDTSNTHGDENDTQVVGTSGVEDAPNYPVRMSIAPAIGSNQGSGSSDIAMSGDSTEPESFDSVPPMPLRGVTRVHMFVEQHEDLQGSHTDTIILIRSIVTRPNSD